ncbi:unnamed protein product [Ectocarpus sp. 13 AM-2016]
MPVGGAPITPTCTSSTCCCSSSSNNSSRQRRPASTTTPAGGLRTMGVRLLGSPRSRRACPPAGVPPASGRAAATASAAAAAEGVGLREAGWGSGAQPQGPRDRRVRWRRMETRCAA